MIATRKVRCWLCLGMPWRLAASNVSGSRTHFRSGLGPNSVSPNRCGLKTKKETASAVSPRSSLDSGCGIRAVLPGAGLLTVTAKSRNLIAIKSTH